MATTAAGSVVAMIAASSRQTTSDIPATGQSASPTTAVATRTAITASRKIGAASSSMRRTSIVIDASNSSTGRKMYSTSVDEIGKSRISSATSLKASVRSVLQKEARGAADEHPDRREEHRGRQVQAGRERLQQADHHQQASHGQQRVGQTEHAEASFPGVSGLRSITIASDVPLSVASAHGGRRRSRENQAERRGPTVGQRGDRRGRPVADRQMLLTVACYAEAGQEGEPSHDRALHP